MKKFMSLAISAILVLSLTSCGDSSNTGTENTTTTPADSQSTETANNTDSTESNTTSAPDTSASTKTKITFTFREDGQGENNPLWKWINDAYATYPNKDKIELDVSPITASEGDYFAKVALALQSKDTAPDLVAEDTFQLPSDASAGYLTKLDDMLKNYSDWNSGAYYDALKAGVTGPDGGIYGVPYSTDSRGLWYNKEIFKQAGLPEDWQPKNWQEVLDACKTIKEKVPEVVPFWCNSAVATGEATSMQTYEMLLYGTGERLLEGDKWIVDSPNIRKSLEFLQTIYNEGYGPSLSLVLNGQASNTSAREYLPKGKLAISLDGFWITGNYLPEGASPWPEYKDVLGYAAMPTSEGQAPNTITLAGGWALSIPQNSDAKDESFAFLQYMMSKELYTKAIVNMGNLSTRADIASDPTYSEKPFMEISTEFLANADFRPQNDKYPVVSSHIQAMVEAVVSGTTIDDAVNQYKTDVTNAVGADNVIAK